MTRCFKSRINNFLHISNEILTGFLHIVLLSSLIQGQNKIKSSATETCIDIITLSWSLNIFCSILKFAAILIEKIKKIRSSPKIGSVHEIAVPTKTENNDHIENETTFTKIKV